MMRKIFVSAMMLALAFVFGCGGGGGPVQLENVCDEMKDAMCSYMEKCDLDWLFQYMVKQTCEEMIDCDEMEINEMILEVEAGRLAYDADLAGKCLSKIRNAECDFREDFFKNLGDECEQVFTGLVVQDGDCYRENECADGLFCDESVSECPGNCQPYKNIGQECSGGDCNPDMADCDYQQGVCVALAGPGGVCDVVDCQDGLVCDDDNQPAVCLDPAGEGGSCTSTRGCETGLQCLSGQCAGPAGAGQACDIGEDGEGFLLACEPKHYCDADITLGERTGTCQPKKGAGSSCILFIECNAGLLCIGVQVDGQTATPGSCGQPLKAGAACNSEQEMFIECDWDLYCNPTTSVCTAYPGIGDPCLQDLDPECWGDDLYCDSALGTCQQRKSAGADCASYEECLSYYCDYGTGKCVEEESCIAP